MNLGVTFPCSSRAIWVLRSTVVCRVVSSYLDDDKSHIIPLYFVPAESRDFRDSVLKSFLRCVPSTSGKEILQPLLAPWFARTAFSFDDDVGAGYQDISFLELARLRLVAGPCKHPNG